MFSCALRIPSDCSTLFQWSLEVVTSIPQVRLPLQKSSFVICHNSLEEWGREWGERRRGGGEREGGGSWNKTVSTIPFKTGKCPPVFGYQICVYCIHSYWYLL